MGRARPEIEEIWLFGSLARDKAAPDSDADILIVVDASDLSFADMLVYTRAELERMQTEGSPFLQQIERASRALAALIAPKLSCPC